MVSFWGDNSQQSNREKKAESKGFSVFGSLDDGGQNPAKQYGTSKHEQRAQPSAGGSSWSFTAGDGRHRVEVQGPHTSWEGEVRGNRGRRREVRAVDHGDAVETYEAPRWYGRASRASRRAGDAMDAHAERKIAEKDMGRDATYGQWVGETSQQIYGTSRNVFSLAARALARRWF